MAEPPVPQRSRSRPGSRCAKGRSALRSPALPAAGHAPPWPQPLDICPLCSLAQARTGHVRPLATGLRLDMPHLRRSRWTYAHCAHRHGLELDMSNGWLGGHCCNFPDVGAWIPETGRWESRGRFIGPLRNPTPRRAASLKAAGASSSKGNWESECLLVETFSRSGVKDFGAVPPGLWRTPHGDANHERNLPSGIRRYPQAPWPQSG